jgi:hypothetical protein
LLIVAVRSDLIFLHNPRLFYQPDSFVWCVIKRARVPMTTPLTDIGASSSINATPYRHC